ncbi:hypothetical protein Tco_1111610 [Tanacetum coccineum]|uniref:Uncharacterized protein n=1 Tax=Tanacetum coccineum TaxID=301880 RepID=A0ABQ5IM67_9ASTR
MQGTNLSKQERHSRLTNEFDKYSAEAGESLTYVYERFSTLEHFDKLYDYLSQCEPHVNASRAKKNARDHDLLALVANSYANPSYSHASLSYSRSPQTYYVSHPPSVHDYDDDYQWEIQGDAREDKLSTAMMLLARAITQHFSTPTNNRLRTLSNTRNEAVIQDGRVDIQSKNVGYVGHGGKNAGRLNENQATTAGNGFAQKNVENEKSVQRIRRTKSTLRKTNLEELNASMIMMARIQPTDNKSDVEPIYDAEVISEVNASQIDLINGLLSKGNHEQQNYEKFKTIKQTFVDDQIDSDTLFDDPYIEDNSGQVEHDQDAHNQIFSSHESLIYNVQVEAKNQHRMNNELKKQNALIQREPRRIRKRVQDFEKKPVQFINYKSGYEKLQNQIRIE